MSARRREAGPAFHALPAALVPMAVGPIVPMPTTSLRPQLDINAGGAPIFAPTPRNSETVLCDWLRYEPEHLRSCPPPQGSLGHLRRLIRWAGGGAEMDDIERAAVEGTEVRVPTTPSRERRMTAGRKREAVLRVLRGEPLEIVARDLAVTAADLSTWRDLFLEAGEASLKSRARDGRDETIARLRTKVGELTMNAELLHTKVERLEGGAPLAGRTPAR